MRKDSRSNLQKIGENRFVILINNLLNKWNKTRQIIIGLEGI
jgi:hypothetical protein